MLTKVQKSRLWMRRLTLGVKLSLSGLAILVGSQALAQNLAPVPPTAAVQQNSIGSEISVRSTSKTDRNSRCLSMRCSNRASYSLTQTGLNRKAAAGALTKGTGASAL